MSRDNRISMPISTAGITRYFEEYKSNFEIKPGHVVILIIIVMLIEFFLHSLGGL